MKKLRCAVKLCTLVFILSACGSKGSSGKPAAKNTTTQTYYESDGSCYKASSNKEVASSNCDKVSSYLNGGRCFRASDNKELNIPSCTANAYFVGDSTCYDSTGESVDSNRCRATEESENSAGSRKRVCSGPHIQFLIDDVLKGDCDGIRDTGNCSGAILFDVNAQEFVDCL